MQRQAEKNLKETAVAFYEAEAAFAAAGGKGLSPNYQRNLRVLGDAAAAYATRNLPIAIEAGGKP